MNSETDSDVFFKSEIFLNNHDNNEDINKHIGTIEDDLPHDISFCEYCWV